MRAAGLKIAIACGALAATAVLTTTTFSAYSSVATNVGSTFATAASYDTCPNQTVSSGLTTGLETGRHGYSGGLLTQGTGTTIDSAVARTGSYSLKVAAAGASNYTVTQFFPTPTTETTRFALRLSTLPAADVTQLFRMGTSTGTLGVQLRYLAASQKLAVAVTGTDGGTATVVPATTTVTAGAWYVVELRYSNGTTTHTVDWQIDEVAQTGASVAGTASGISRTSFGTQTTDTFTANYDDIMIVPNGTAYPLGDGRVRALTPSSMGTSVGAASFQNDDGTAIDAASWQRLDDIPMTSISDYIQQTSVGSSNYVELALSDTTQTCIRSVFGYAAIHSAATNADNNVKTSIFDAAQESVLHSGTTTANVTGSRDYGKPVTPASTWSQAALNGLVGRFGYGSDVAPVPMLDAIVLEYEVPQ